VQFIKDAYGDNPKEYANTLVRFGLEQNYNLIDKEATPYIKKPGNADWDGFSINSMAMGYAVEMTAINMVAFYNTIANGGRQMQPRLVKAVLNNGKVVKEFPTRVLDEQLFTKEVADTMTSMLVNVVNGRSIIADKKNWQYGMYDGTGKNARSELMTIAGKTGTAKQHSSDDKLMSFCGFFPAEAPEYTLIVQIMYDEELDPRSSNEKKRNGYGGGNTSAKVFKEIAERIMTKQ
jgi:cell division protein FtsI (penicillin-binding protein 3)